MSKVTKFVLERSRSLNGWVAVLFAVWIIGQIFRDLCWLTGLAFYFPSPLMFLTLMGVMLYLGWRKRPYRHWAVAALLPLLVVGCVENHWTTPPAQAHSGTPLKLIHWNVMGTRVRWDRLMEEFLPLQPDLVVLSEVHPRTKASGVIRKLGVEYTSLRISNMIVLARGRLFRVEPLTISQGIAHLVRWEFAGREWKVLAADMPSDIRIPRDGVLKELVELVRVNQPDFVVGDLNAPRLSRQLCRLPTGYRHAYDEAGSGWSYTWPVCWPGAGKTFPPLEWIYFIPMWGIDQCILGPRVVALEYRLISTHVSDHRMQVLETAAR
ncbi:MAG: hypothetical protein U0903_21350 [Planctomycetales bacterium]